MKKPKPLTVQRVQVWTRCYRPFIMGGDVNQPSSCAAEAEGPFDLGRGYKGYVVQKPLGGTAIAESMTGVLIGPDLKSVREDIKSGDPAVMREQMVEAIGQGRKARAVTAEEF